MTHLPPPTRASLTLAVGALLVLAARPNTIAAQAGRAPQRPVTAVRLLIDGQASSDANLQRLIEVAPGAPLSRVQVRESIVLLMALNRFADVQAVVDQAGGGLALTFAATSLRKVSELAFRGDLGLSERELRGKVVEQFSTSPPVSRAEEISRALESFCRDHGFLTARVTAHVEPGPRPDRATLAFEVAAGTRVRLGRADAEAPGDIPKAQVLDRLGLRAGLPVDPAAVRRSATEYADSFRAKGFFEARVGPQFAFAPDGSLVDVTVTVDRGPLVTLEFRGDPIPPSRQAELVPVRREGSVDEDLLEDSQRNIEDYFRAEGYRDAEVTYSPEQSDGRLKIVFNVSKGPQYRVAGVEIVGSVHIPLADLRASLRTQAGTLFVRSTLDADVAAVAERYRRLGFAGVKVTPTVVPQPGARSSGQATVTVRLEMVEGPRTVVGTMTLEGQEHVPAGVLMAPVRLAPGAPYFASALAQDREAVLVELLDRGFQTATVDTPVTFSSDRTRADIRIVVHEGPQVLIDHVLVVGNSRTTAQTIEREVQLKPGQPLAISGLVEAQRRLIALGLFRRVSVTELQHESDAGRDVLVSVEEAPPTSFSWGGGVEGSRRLVRQGSDGGETVEQIDIAPRGFIEIGRRNLWGKNRTVNLFARVAVRSGGSQQTTTTDGTTTTTAGGYGVSEYRVQVNYREPRVIRDSSDLLVTAASERGYRSSFNFDRQLGLAELVHRFPSNVSVSGRYSIESTFLFSERFNPSDKLLIDRLFPQVRLSIVSATVARDRRDDALDPASGTLTSIVSDLALRSLGSEVGFAKSYVQGYYYRRLPGSRRIVFAGGARIGLARGFATSVDVLDENGNPVVGPDGRPVTVVVQDLPASERFFAGGATTVRGFTTDRLGTPETIDRDGFPQGGMGMVIFNAELRVPVWRWIGAVGFVDAGNVFARAGDISLGRFLSAVGVGLRLRWPVLPIIRLDVGYNPRPRVFTNGSREKSWAVYFGIGQAF